jgi:hypothetical protein
VDACSSVCQERAIQGLVLIGYTFPVIFCTDGSLRKGAIALNEAFIVQQCLHLRGKILARTGSEGHTRLTDSFQVLFYVANYNAIPIAHGCTQTNLSKSLPKKES